MSTFITKLDTAGDGPRLAVKDIVDVEGVPTTAGCRAMAEGDLPAAADAACLTGARAAGARIVGKTNLQELAMLPIGTNPWFGSPINPLDADLIPGGSSSGSAVAVATDEADVAIGTDTGGSIRVPSACCGTFGLKTTYGRVSRQGVWPLAPSLDTVGPMAASPAGLALGMELLEPGFTQSPAAARVVGRIRTAGDPMIEAAVDGALRAAGFEVIPLEWDGLAVGGQAFMAIFFSEIWEVDHALVERHPDGVGANTSQVMAMADQIRQGGGEMGAGLEAWRQSLLRLFEQVELLALPTMPIFPSRLDELGPDTLLPICLDLTMHIVPFNVAGTPCTAQPVQARGSAVPASLQLVGPLGGEELLVATVAHVDAAIKAG